MQNRHSLDKRNRIIDSGKICGILLRFTVALLTLLITTLYFNQNTEAKVYFVYYSVSSLPDDMADIYGNYPERFLFTRYPRLQTDTIDESDELIVPDNSEAPADNFYDASLIYDPDPSKISGNGLTLTKKGKGTLQMVYLFNDDIHRIIVSGGILQTANDFSMNQMFNTVTGSNAEWHFASYQYSSSSSNSYSFEPYMLYDLSVADSANGNAQFNILNGGRAMMGSLNIANGDDSIGRVIVDGENSRLTANYFNVGNSVGAKGYLDISNTSAAVANNEVNITGGYYGSHGLVNVVGGASLQIGGVTPSGSSTPTVGSLSVVSSAILNIIDGGRVNVNGLYDSDGNYAGEGDIYVLGSSNNTGYGTIIVSGSGSTLNAGNLYMNYGTLGVMNSGSVSIFGNTRMINSSALVAMGSTMKSGGLNIGSFSSSQYGFGTVNVLRSYLTIDIGGAVEVGSGNATSSGRLNLFNRSRMSGAASLLIGTGGGQGLVNVANSELSVTAVNENNGNITVGSINGLGMLNLTDGATATANGTADNANNGKINIGGNGMINVTGAGSVLTANDINVIENDASLNITRYGRAEAKGTSTDQINNKITISNGAAINVTNNSSLTSASGFELSNGSLMNITNNSSVTTNGDFIINGSIVNFSNGSLALNGSASLIVNGSADNKGILNFVNTSSSSSINTSANTAHSIGVGTVENGFGKMVYGGSINPRGGNISVGTGKDSDGYLYLGSFTVLPAPNNDNNVGDINIATGEGSSGYFRIGSGTVRFGNLTIGAGGTLITGATMSTKNVDVTINGILGGTGSIRVNEDRTADAPKRNGFKFGTTGKFAAGNREGEVGTLTLYGPVTLDNTANFRVDFDTSATNSTNDLIRISPNDIMTGDGTPAVRSEVVLPNDSTINVDLSSLISGNIAKNILSVTNGQIVNKFTDFPTTDVPSPTPTHPTGVQFNVTLNGEDVSTSNRIAGTIGGDIASNNALRVVFNNVSYTNQEITWNSQTGGTWNLTDANWTTTTYFLDGDAVIFDDVNGTITLGGNGKTVARMTVSGATTNVTFDGNIFADGSKAKDINNHSDNGKLILNSTLGTTGQITLNGENTFRNGIYMEGGILNIVNDLALGTYVQNTLQPDDSEGQVTVDGTNMTAGDFATINFSDNRTISNRFQTTNEGSLQLNIDSNRTLTVENISSNSGSAISLLEGTDNAITGGTNSTLIMQNNNTSGANGNGGALSVSELASQEIAVNLKFYNNVGSGDGGAIYADDTLTLSGARSEFIGNSSSGGRGGAIYVDKDLTIDGATFDSLLTFIGNTAYDGGGAIYVNNLPPVPPVTALTISNNVIFSGNSTMSGNGGAIFANGGVEITNASTIFLGNEVGGSTFDGDGGAIYADGDVTITSSLINFIGNKSQRGQGGAIYSTGDVTLNLAPLSDETILIASNSALGDGGAIHSNSLTTTGNTSFVNNRSVGRGGAFFGNQLTVNGNTSFRDNYAISGGAAYITAGGRVTLDSSTGDISFTDNGTENASIVPNSLYIESGVTLTLSGDHNIYFDDPILSYDDPNSTTTDGGNSLTKNGDGFVQFVGENILNPKDSTNAGNNNVVINAGTFRLAGIDMATPSSLTTSTVNGTFDFVADTILAGQGTLTAKSFSFANGVLLNPDNDRFETPGGIGYAYATPGRNEVTYSRSTYDKTLYSKVIGIYKLDGDVTFGNVNYNVDLYDAKFIPNSLIASMPSAGDKTKQLIGDKLEELDPLKYKVDYDIRQSDDIVIIGDVVLANTTDRVQIALNNWVDGVFELMRSDKDLLQLGWFGDDNGDEILTDAESGLKVAGMPVGSRQEANLVIDEVDTEGDGIVDYNRLLLITATPYYNKDLLWTGLTSYPDWNTTTPNWRDNWTSDRETFNPNDYVFFDGKGIERNNINIANEVQVSGMKITGGSHTFVSKGNPNGNNGKIIGVAPTESNGQLITGKLEISTTEETIINIPTSFVNGINIGNKGNIRIGHAEALGKLTNQDDGDQSGIVYFHVDLSSLSLTDTEFMTPTIRSIGNTMESNVEDTKNMYSSNWFYIRPKTSDPYGFGLYTLTLEVESGKTWTIQGNDGVIASQKVQDTQDEQYSSSFPNPLLDRIKAGVLFVGTAQSATIKGGISFLNNIAPENYGAIHLDGGNDLNFDSTNGDIIFAENFDGTTAGSVARSISIDGSENLITLTGSKTGDMFFDDPIQTLDANVTPAQGDVADSADMLIDFRYPDGSNTNTFVQFRGENILNGSIDVRAGVMRLANDRESKAGSIDLGEGSFALRRDAILAGSGTIITPHAELVGTISPDSYILVPTTRTTNTNLFEAYESDDLRAGIASIGTIKFTGNVLFYDATFDIDLMQRKTTDSNGRTILENLADRIDVDGNITFKNDLNMLNTINISDNDWSAGKYTIMTADYIEPVDEHWAIRYKGASIVYYPVNSDSEEYHVIDNSRIALAVIKDQKMILHLRSDTPFGDIIEWDGDEDWNNQNTTDKNLIVLNYKKADAANKTDTEIITIGVDEMTISGLEVYNGDPDVSNGTVDPYKKVFELRLPTRDAKGKLTITPTVEFEDTVANGKLYVHSNGVLLTSIPIDAQYGTLLGWQPANDINQTGTATGHGTIIYGVQDAFGVYKERYIDEQNSQGRITVGGQGNEIHAKVTVDAKNRIVLESGAELTISVADGETFRLTGVETSANGAAIAVVNGDLTLEGNIIIANNTSKYVVNTNPTNNASLLTQPATSYGYAAGEGKGGGMYLQNSNLTFDTTKGGIEISGNKDKDGASGILLITKNHHEKDENHVDKFVNVLDVLPGDEFDWTDQNGNGYIYLLLKYDGGNTITFEGESEYGVDFIDPVLSEYSSTIYNPHKEPSRDIGTVNDPNNKNVNNILNLNFVNPNAFAQFTRAELGGQDNLGTGSQINVNSGTLRLAGQNGTAGSSIRLGAASEVNVLAKGRIAGNGTITATKFDIDGGHLSPDNEKFTITNSIIDKANLTGTITLDGEITMQNSVIDVDLKANNTSDKIILANTGGYFYDDPVNNNRPAGDPAKYPSGNSLLTNNYINVNAWQEGNFVVFESASGILPPDMLERFSILFGNDVNGSRQTGKLLFGAADGVADFTTLHVKTEMKPEDRRRLVWTNNANGFLTTSAVGNWFDYDNNKNEQFNNSDYLIFTESGNQKNITLNGTELGNVILGKPVYNSNDQLVDVVYGAKTFSGLLIGGGNYTFTGGDFFGIKARFGEADENGNYAQLNGDVTIAAGNITFKNNLYTEGFIEILNNATVTLLGHKAFHAEEELRLAETAKLIIEPADNLIKAKSISLEGEIELVNEPKPSVHNKPRINKLLTATETPLDTQQLDELFTHTFGLWKRDTSYSDDNLSMDLIYSAVALNEYANIHQFNHNNRSIAEYFAQVFNNWGEPEFEKSLMNLNDAQLKSLFDSISNAVIYAEAKHLALSNPYRAVASHLFSMQEVDNHRYNYALLRGAARDPKVSREFWFTLDQLELQMNGDGNGQEFRTSRAGFNIGVDKRFGNAFLAGMMFTSGGGKLYQRNYGNRIEVDDFVLGFYMQYQFLSELQINTFGGIGWQDYDGRRYGLKDTSTLEHGIINSKYTGDSAFWNFELVRPIHWRSGILFLPAFGIEFRHAATNDFTEDDAFNSQYSKSNTDQFFIKAGFNSLWKLSDRFRLESRAWYYRQVGGNDSLIFNMSLPNMTMIDPAQLNGVNAGRDYMTLGIGTRYYLTNKKRSQLFLNYSFDRGNRSKAHIAEVGINHNW